MKPAGFKVYALSLFCVFLTSKFLCRNMHIQTKSQCNDIHVPDSLSYTEY